MSDSRVSDLEDFLKKGKSAKAKYEASWFLNLAYYQGEQWVAWDGRNLYKPQLRRDRMTIVDNRIQPAIRTEVAKMTKQRPVFTVTPRTGDQQDVEAAYLAEQLMEPVGSYFNARQANARFVVVACLWRRVS